MQTSGTVVEISKALAKAQPAFARVGKSGKNQQQGYKFADLDDYLTACRGPLAEHGLSIAFSTEEAIELATRKTKSGGELYGIRVRVVARLLHVSGEWIEAGAYGEGTDSSDKAVYKAITGARKYATAALLGLATTDDPERDEPKRAAERSAKKGDGGNGSADSEPPTTDQLDRMEAWVLDERLPTTVRDTLAKEMAGGLTKKRAGAIIGRIKEKYARELGLKADREPGQEG